MAKLTKICANCKTEKPISEFYKNKQQKDGFHVYCIDCHKWQQKYKWPQDKEKAKEYKKWYLENGGEEVVRNWQYQQKYGISIDEYNKLFEQQNGCCAICGAHQSELPRRLDVEHSHITNKVRGLTCGYCNRKIAWYEQYEEQIQEHLRKGK